MINRCVMLPSTEMEIIRLLLLMEIMEMEVGMGK